MAYKQLTPNRIGVPDRFHVMAWPEIKTKKKDFEKKKTLGNKSLVGHFIMY